MLGWAGFQNCYGLRTGLCSPSPPPPLKPKCVLWLSYPASPIEVGSVCVGRHMTCLLVQKFLNQEKPLRGGSTRFRLGAEEETLNVEPLL